MEPMTFEQFYAQSLALTAPWKIASLKVQAELRRVEVVVVCPPGQVWVDPTTQERATIKDWQDREWRHTDSLEFQTIVRARVPRITLSNGKTMLVSVPWAEPGGRFTRAFEDKISQYLVEAKTARSAARLASVTVDQVDGVMRRAVRRGLGRRELQPIKIIGMDEKAFRRGQRYVTVLHDLDNHRILDLVEDRTEAAAQALLQGLPQRVRDSVEAVAMDMWKPYEKAASAAFPQADVVFDRFHVSKKLNEAVDKVRRGERRSQAAAGDNTLAKSKYLWLRRRVDLRTTQGKRFRDLLNQDLDTGVAWSLKQNFLRFWDHTTWSRAFRFLEDWVEAARDTGLSALATVADMIDKRAHGLLNYIHHRVTNAASESQNAGLQELKAAARGLPNFASLRIRALFFFGKLDMRSA